MAGKLIDAKSRPASRSELSLFDIPCTQVAFESSRWLNVLPSNSVTNSGPYIFNIRDNRNFIQLSKSYIVLRLRVNKIQNADKIALCNYIGATFFSQVKMEINNIQMFDCTDYSYKSYIETLLNRSIEEKSTHLRASGFYQDQVVPGVESLDSADCEGYKQRAAACEDKKTIEVIAPLHIDQFSTDRLIIPHVNIQFTLHRNTDSFLIEDHSGGDTPQASIDVLSMHMLIHQVNVVSSAGLALEKAMLTHSAKYPFRRTKIKILSVEGGRVDLPFSTIFTDIIPKRIIVCCVDQHAKDGVHNKNPFNFQHFNISEVRIDAAGVTFPSQPLRIDFANNLFAETFTMFYENIGALSENRQIGISPDLYKCGHTFFAFNLSPTDSNSFELLRTGNTSLAIHFGKKVPAGGIQVIVYAEFDGMFQIDRFRNIYTDNSA